VNSKTIRDNTGYYSYHLYQPKLKSVIDNSSCFTFGQFIYLQYNIWYSYLQKEN